MRYAVLWSCCLLALVACSGGRNAGDVAPASAAVAPKGGAEVDARPRPAGPRVAQMSIANAPDQGALVAYPADTAPEQEGALSRYPVAMSEAHALASIASGEMRLSAPDGSPIRLRYLRHTEQIGGNWTWIGQVVGGDPNQNAVITFGPEAVFGTIPQKGLQPIQVQTRQGRLFLVVSDAAHMNNERRADDARIPPASAALSEVRGALETPQLAKRAVRMAQAGSVRPAPDPSNTVDIVVGYSSGLVAELGTETVVQTRLAYLVEYGNQAFENSEVAAHLRLVGTVGIDYSDATTNDSTLDDLTEGALAMSQVHQARERFGADAAVMVRPLQSGHDGCGLAWVLGGGQTPIVPADAGWAFGVVSDGSYSEGASTFYCTDSTFAHEVGHILGSTHDRANSSGSGGRYVYSYGYNTNGVCDAMAYCDDGNTEYQVFSNPRITFCGGVACGAENAADNARSLNQTIPIIATFRATVVPHVGQARARSDFDGDGRSDLSWRNLVDGRNILWWGADYGNQRDAGQVANLAWRVAGIGDFDGDGESDMFWRNVSTGQNILWPSGDIARLGYPAAVTNTAWQVAGVADFNGDGRDDIFWRNSSSGGNIIWWSGQYAGHTNEQAVSVAWKVAATGDYDGDGESDVFWRNGSTGANIVWWSGDYAGFSSLNPVTNLAWEVVASDDFDGDGRADLFWRNRGTGENIVWWRGSYAERQQEVTISTNWKVGASGDYDGDGEADLFWRNAVTGQNVVWDSGRYANRRNLTGVTNLAWGVQP